MNKVKLTILLSLLAFSACEKPIEKRADSNSLNSIQEKEVPEEIIEFKDEIEQFFTKLDEPKPNDWLANFEEDGQTFRQFINSKPTLPTKDRRTIYIQPIGNFSKKQQKVIKSAEEFLGKFYILPTKLLKTKNFKRPLSLANKRTHPITEKEQVRTGYILEELLYPNLPEDAAALISFTDADLYPNDNFNFVFGQASLKNRVGVWSFHRLEKNADLNLLMRRVLKIAIHETGHMFSIYHCTAFSCAMNGTNHLGESDRRPLDFCPEDSAKIIWMTNANPHERYESLSAFSFAKGLNAEGKLFKEKAKVLKAKVVTK